MTVDKAINELINSELFKEQARHNGKLRVALSRINKGTANAKLKIDLLERFGYIISVKRAANKL
jgi:hypothetical protein